MRQRRQPEIIAGRVAADGSIQTGDGFSVQKTGAGAYTINLPSGFRTVGFTMSAYAGAGAVGGTFSASSVTSYGITTYNSSFAATDGAFSFIAVGVQQ